MTVLLSSWMVAACVQGSARDTEAVESAISDGVDDFSHTGVGVMMFQSPDGLWGYFCSGTLISPTVYLTAGHCTEHAKANGVAAGVSFIQALPGPPPYSASAVPIQTGRAITHPVFEELASSHAAPSAIFQEPADIGVIVLDSPAVGLPIARMPSEGGLKELGLRNHDTRLTVVGYGRERSDGRSVQGSTPPRRRQSATVTFQNLTPGGFVQLGMVPEQGNGGVCFGDSGGPTYASTSDGELLTSVNVIVSDPNCDNQGWGVRLDTPVVRDFLGQFVSLP